MSNSPNLIRVVLHAPNTKDDVDCCNGQRGRLQSWKPSAYTKATKNFYPDAYNYGKWNYSCTIFQQTSGAYSPQALLSHRQSTIENCAMRPTLATMFEASFNDQTFTFTTSTSAGFAIVFILADAQSTSGASIPRNQVNGQNTDSVMDSSAPHPPSVLPRNLYFYFSTSSTTESSIPAGSSPTSSILYNRRNLHLGRLQ